MIDGEPVRLRRLFGTGFVVLTGNTDRCKEITESFADVPLTVHALPEIDTDAILHTALRASDTVHLIRPDGHLAAVLPSYDPGALTRALRRACGNP